MSSLQDRMYNYEANPPAGTWDKIAAALDESSSENEFPSRLYNMEVTPPASAWDAINASLSLDETEEKVVPLRKRRTAFLRYAAAAVFIGLVALGVVRFTNISGKSEKTTITSTSGNETTGNTENLSKDNNIHTPAPNSKTVSTTNNESQGKNEVYATTKRKTSLRQTENIRSSAYSDLSYNESIMSNDAGNNALYTYEDHSPDISNRYIMLMTPDGNIIRMSKKWSDLICCVSGEEQDEDCKTQLKQWQKKIATSPISPSSGNFLDLLDLVSSLEDSPDL